MITSLDRCAAQAFKCDYCRRVKQRVQLVLWFSIGMFTYKCAAQASKCDYCRRVKQRVQLVLWFSIGMFTYMQRNDPHRSRGWTSILEIAEKKRGKNSRLRRDPNPCLPERTSSAQLSTELRRHKLGARQMFDRFFCYIRA